MKKISFKTMMLATIVIASFLAGAVTTAFATHDSRFDTSMRSRKNYEAACIFKGIIDQEIENLQALDEDDPDGNWNLYAISLEEALGDAIDNVDCYNLMITSKELRDNYNNRVWETSTRNYYSYE